MFNDTWKIWLSLSRCSCIFRRELRNIRGSKVKWGAWKERHFPKIIWKIWKAGKVGGEKIIGYVCKETCELGKVKFPELPAREETWVRRRWPTTRSLWGKERQWGWGEWVVCHSLNPLYKLRGVAITYFGVSLSLGFPRSGPQGWDLCAIICWGGDLWVYR